MKKIIFLLLLVNCYTALGQCYTAIQCADGTSIARRTDGTLWVKGANNQGCAGNGNTEAVLNYTAIGMDTDWSENYSVSRSHVLAIKNNGTLWAWGSESYGACGTGTQGSGVPIVPTQIGTDSWLAVSSSDRNSLGIKSDGTLWAWGSNYSGQLGIGSNLNYNQLTPIQTGTDNDWQKVFSAYDTCFAIKTDGTLWSWGNDGDGVLGYIDASPSIARLSPHLVNTDTDWSAIATDGRMAFGLKTNGTLWGWGLTLQGLYGNGTTSLTYSNTPIQIGTDTDWKQISMNTLCCVALKTNGTRWGWGNNASYYLGNGTTANYILVPTQLDTDTDWVYTNVETFISGLGGNAIKQNNSLFSWGYNFSTNLPNPTPAIEGTTCLLGTEVFSNPIFSIYPNPSTEAITIQFNLKQSSKIEIKILDILGNIHLSEESNVEATYFQKQINLSNYAAGIYFLSVETNTGNFKQKIIKN